MQAVRKSQFLSSRQEGCRYFYVLRTAAIFFLISLAQNSANAFSCDCLTAEETKAFELASITCKTEMQNLQCSKLTDVDPSLQEDLQKCDVKSVCEALTQERMNATGQVSPTTVKACFWASAELVKEVWGLATSVPPEIQPYLSNPFGLSFLIGKKLGENLAQTTKEDWANLPQKISDATSDENIIKQSKKIWSSGVDWAKDKKLKLQCFNVQAQQEMVCYGILSVWGPEKAVSLGAKGLKALKILKATKAVESLETAAASEAKILSATAERASDLSKAERVVTREANSTRDLTRQKFVDDYARAEITTEKQRRRFQQITNKPRNPKKRGVSVLENSKTKDLNDKIIADKDVVTALNKKQMQIYAKRLEALKRKYPNVEFATYSDFKAVNLAYEAKRGNLPLGLQTEIDKIFSASSKEYLAYLKANKLVRAEDKPEDWFKLGHDDSLLESSWDARVQRESGVRNISKAEREKAISANYQAADMYRKEALDILKNTQLVDQAAGKKVLTESAFDLVRKSKSNQELRLKLEKKHGVKVTNDQAKNLRDYVDLVNSFQPPLLTLQQGEIVSLASAKHGGMISDFKGMNAKNYYSTAKSLANSKNLREAGSKISASDQLVTAEIQANKKAYATAAAKVYKKHKIPYRVMTSGDDSAIIPLVAVKDEVALELFTEVSKATDFGIRNVNVSAKFPSYVDKGIIGGHGEEIEKRMIEHLDGIIPEETLSKIDFLVDLRPGPKSAQAQVFGSEAGRDLDVLERVAIRDAFLKSLEEVNQSLKIRGLPIQYTEFVPRP